VIAGLDPVYGGPSYCVPRLCEALGAAGAEATLLSVATGAGEQRDVYCRGYQDRRFAWDYARVPILRELRSSQGLSTALRDTSLAADVIHCHGLWLMPNISAARAAAARQTPFLASTHGMLAAAALAFSRTKKRAHWLLFQGPAIRGAACIHVTSEPEYEEIRSFSLTNPVVIIPYGIDLPELPSERMATPLAERIVLSLGRIHPKKGLHRLVYAWSKIEADHPSWRLKIVGPPEVGHDDELHALAKELGLTRVSVEGPVYGNAKTAAYQDADLFVLPTLNENFGITVAEALATGTPAISTIGAPWGGLESEGCGWWIDHGVESLAAALVNAMALPREALRAMGDKGRKWMVRDFSWDRVARDMVDVYLWLAREAEPPKTIRFD
jgi:glycosyltransferase involved in cell wall biosynthesis